MTRTSSTSSPKIARSAARIRGGVHSAVRGMPPASQASASPYRGAARR